MILAENVAKSFGETVALRGFDLLVPAGRVAAVLGPNGAGKTTAVRILATLLRPDGGRAVVGGHDVVLDPAAVRRVIGLTGQYASVDADLSGVENLVLVGRLLGLSRAAAKARAAELLDRFGLTSSASRPSTTYSGGMRRRLDLAASLVGRPRVLYLDEPTTGLDPHARRELWAEVRQLVKDGVTVLLTTQYLEEADQLADRITVLNGGGVVAEGTADELKRRTGGHTLQVRTTSLADMDTAARIVGRITRSTPLQDSDAGLLTAPVSDPAVLTAVIRELDQAGVTATEVALRLPSLDEVFLTLTGTSA
ncbi:daunorubicin resistance protein DrrA family ABC transporter ATP-binding protein [Kibdelosporangium aridum]|uniref:Daunorubicin resistance protein DrrA family ABC transporter ATP-binding protein n=1 Tax=Kibdelosporangium aridum TaxID=2030 RepID=A0A428ZJ23_KIBAR|nr:daunorubicin resistance protein DrrA family ABC transporter ATP-binding protein [Kibdelosporangium aridum]RSM87958.1 daunorubicin resistance protein DrrA family ABC transporter ATP-binding protein [Kibdelosporangium aridum]